MIINNKENNKDEQHPHIPNEHPTRHSPPFGGVGGGFNSLPPEALEEVSSARHIPSFGGAWGGSFPIPLRGAWGGFPST